MEKEYIISFSSFYKAAYAQEILADAGIGASLRKLPNELVRSCGKLLDEAQLQIKKVIKGADGKPMMEDFDDEPNA